jgi:hypothetical protein
LRFGVSLVVIWSVIHHKSYRPLKVSEPDPNSRPWLFRTKHLVVQQT